MLRINLLPPQQKKRLELKALYQNIISSGFILFLLILFLIVFLAGFLIFLNFRYRVIENRITVEQSKIIQTQTVKEMEKKLKDLNRELEELGEIETGRSNLYSILDNISSNLLLGVRVYTLEVNRSSEMVTISGFSPSRENLLAIKKILETDSHYKNVDFPLSNLANPQNINFRFSFIYAP